jgi:hypothetical protein
MQSKAVAERQALVGFTGHAVALAPRNYHVVAMKRMLAAGQRREYVTIAEAMAVSAKMRSYGGSHGCGR